MITILGRSIQKQMSEKLIGDRQIAPILYAAVRVAVYNPSNWEVHPVV